MRVLALETSQRRASVALLEKQHPDAGTNAKMLATSEIPSEQRTAQALLPAVSQLLKQSNWSPSQVDLICVTTGPGSFTGLRIGVTAAKTWAYATGAKLIGVHTLQAIASRVAEPPKRLWTILDAERKELFVSLSEAEKPLETQLLKTEDWLEQLQSADQVTGPPLVKLKERLPAEVTITPEELWAPQAIDVGQLGIAALERSEEVPPLRLVPEYFRRSAAEEKATQKASPA